MTTQTTFRVFTTILFTLFIFGCKTYYKAKTVSTSSGTTNIKTNVDSLNRFNRYLVLRNGDQAFHIKNIQFNSDSKTASCTLDSLDIFHRLHLTKGRDGRYWYKRSDITNAEVVREVHIYIPKDNTAANGSYNLQLDKISMIEILEHDQKRTTNSYVLGTIGTVLGTMALAAIIIAATKSSCPFVAAYDGNDYSLQGEIYGGAIYPQLSRRDYLPLKMKPLDDGTLGLKITNELKERQYTDYVKLWKITHDKEARIFVNEKGELISVSNPVAPVLAVNNGKKDVLPALLKANDYTINYMDDSSMANARNEVVMKFNKPKAAAKGKLVLALKNSYFLDLLYGELAKGFGSYYATYTSHQKKKSATELLKWVKEQQIPLDISVKTTKGWQNVTSLTTVGPLAFRETAINIDLTDVPGEEVEVKLGTGFMFWEIDYAAMDFSADKNFRIEKMNPVSATDETGKNVLDVLLKEDAVYLDQPQIGNAATIIFKPTVQKTSYETETYIMESKGYYEHIRDFKNEPDLKFLEQFRDADAFPRFGVSFYRKIAEQTIAAGKKLN